jgi:hypothetical protein
MSEEPKVPLSDPRINVTTVEPVAYKQDVAGYHEHPVVELAQGVLGCEFCGYNRFRRSRIRFPDLLELLRLRLPMRCIRCSQRQYHDANLALLSVAAKTHGPRVSEGIETWQSWTGANPDKPMSTRPMTTAVGTRAQRLPRAGDNAASPAPPSRTPRRGGGDDIW